MPRYLVLANQPAASPELTNAVREIVAKDAETEFVLLVPPHRWKISSIGRTAIVKR